MIKLPVACGAGRDAIALDFDITINNTAIEDTAPFPNPKIIDLIVGIWHCSGEHLIFVKTLLLAPSFFLLPQNLDF